MLGSKNMLVSLDQPYYHSSSRGVRRIFLSGKDAVTSQSFELFLLLDNCSCVVLMSYVPVTMQNSHTCRPWQ
jgi:hypothetical protein